MFGCFYKNELENKMPGMTIENIAAACEGTFVGDRVTQAQLRNRLEPEKGVFIAESPINLL